MAKSAAERGGLQPVIDLSADGKDRATVGTGAPIELTARLEMPPETGLIVKYGWTIANEAEGATVLEKPQETGGVEKYSWTFSDAAEAVTTLDKPQPLVELARTVTFSDPGTYVVRLKVSGQRDGLPDPANQTLLQNFRDVRVVVE